MLGFSVDELELGEYSLLVSPAAGPAEAGPRKAVLRGVGSLGSGSILSPRKSVLFSWELWSWQSVTLSVEGLMCEVKRVQGCKLRGWRPLPLAVLRLMNRCVDPHCIAHLGFCAPCSHTVPHPP
jgi:hypothetical protein